MNGIINKLSDKRILIFGYGREGKSTEEFIKKHVNVKSLEIFEGKREDIDESKYDFIIKSPGIVMLEDNPKYTSQTELFLDEYADRTIGVTGTKGKSTTSSMISHVLNQCGRKAILLGNIGKPCFDMIDEIEETGATVVFELSCHQLLHINKAPHISVFLNLFEEHLDYYGTMDKYFGAKAHIVSHQKKGDFALLGSNVPDTDEIKSESEHIVIEMPHTDYNLRILGEHNKLNAEFVYYIAAELCKLDALQVVEAIESFTGLPHRLEFFGNYNGIDYYDDSISTIPEACINATECVKNAETVIVGGMDRGIDYDILVDFIKTRKDIKFILCYATGERIYKQITGRDELEAFTESEPVSFEMQNFVYVADLNEAVALAKVVTGKDRACILSPAAPSYGYFKNFEERGEVFKELCR